MFDASFRYGLVLAFILIALAFQVAAPEAEWSRLVDALLFATILELCLWAAQTRTRVLLLAGGLGVAIVLMALLIVATTGHLGKTPARIIGLVVVAFAPIAIAHGLVESVRQEGTVTPHTMFAVLCIYLLIGMIFAGVYGIIDADSSGDFFASGEIRTLHPELHGASPVGTASDYLYFSFSTLTTVGYGDLTAGTDLGRSLSVTEALVGQIYLVTVVAVIVGNLRRSPRRRRAGQA